MPTMRFHRDLYAVAAVDEAIRVFGGHGAFSRKAESSYEEVVLEATEPTDERQLVGEFANYVLALTIEKNRT
jgi:hypothetical protein